MASTSLIRPFAPSDLLKVRTLDQRVFGHLAYSAKIFDQFHRERPELFLVYEIGEAIAAYVIATVRDDEGYIVSIAVRDDLRRSGIGSALVKRIEDLLTSSGITLLSLDVREKNIEGINFWKNLGFDIYVNINHYYIDGQNAIKMRKFTTAVGAT
jgi:ribosomal-protein-alanine N-acetyltransferase